MKEIFSEDPRFWVSNALDAFGFSDDVFETFVLATAVMVLGEEETD